MYSHSAWRITVKEGSKTRFHLSAFRLLEPLSSSYTNGANWSDVIRARHPVMLHGQTDRQRPAKPSSDTGIKKIQQTSIFIHTSLLLLLLLLLRRRRRQRRNSLRRAVVSSVLLLYSAATRSPSWPLPISVVVLPRVFFHTIYNPLLFFPRNSRIIHSYYMTSSLLSYELNVFHCIWSN